VLGLPPPYLELIPDRTVQDHNITIFLSFRGSLRTYIAEENEY